MTSKENIWVGATEYLKDELSEFVYDQYFESIKPLDYDIENNSILLQVPREEDKITLEEQYTVLVSNALKFVTGRFINIEFVVAESNNMVWNPTEEEKPKRKPKTKKSNNYVNLNPEYTFDTFVVGPNNRFAHAAALAVADAPGKKYNPLFIYGGVGLGKTHLMHAISQYILKKDPTKRVLFLSSEQFLNEYIESLTHKTIEQFRNKYRNVDVLVIDDIQFIAGKEQIQIEFFNTFNVLQGNNKQIILTSDKPPKEIPELEDRLRSRFSIGLLCDIGSPDYETRLAILIKKVQEKNYKVDKEILEYIAENIKTNIRELEGTLLKVVALSEFYDKHVTLDVVKENLKDIISLDNKEISMDDIITSVCDYYNVTKDEILSKRRTKNIAHARQVVMYLSRELTDNSLPMIGSYLGGRDHSTVIHGYDKICKQLEVDGHLERDIQKINVNIKNNK